MLIQRRTISLAVVAALWTVGCSDDDSPEMNTQDGSTEAGTNPDAGADGGPDIDATPGRDADIDGEIDTTPDGSLPDGGEPGPDAGDGGAPGMDATVPTDATVTTDATGPDGGPCDVVHPQFGCGTEQGNDWVTFSSGVQVDRVNKVAWTAPMSVVDDDALAAICATINYGGLTGWNLPQMEDVRKLAAGCPETVPGGACLVKRDRTTREEAGDCTCDTGLTGPNNGKFCRAGLPSCETLWVWTHTWEDPDAGQYEHWFYDVNTGSIVPAIVGQGISLEAKGRCMHPLSPDTVL